MSDDGFDDDDLIKFQLESITISINYSQLIRYSEYYRQKYLYSDAIKYIPQEIHNFQVESNIAPESIDYCFQFIQHNCKINENLLLTYIQCVDILRLSERLGVRKLSHAINKYIKEHNISVDFIFQMIQYETQTRNKSQKHQVVINAEIENILTSKINECFENERFAELDISIIYRVVQQAISNGLTNDILYDFIKKSFSKFYVLFTFLDLKQLSRDRLQDLCKIYSNLENENQLHYFTFIRCNLSLINQIIEENQSLQKQLDLNKINGQVVASVKNGLLIGGKINLIANGTLLDVRKSKYIISTDNSMNIGAEAYELGEPITSLNMTTIDFLVKEDTYYIRCIIFDIGGQSLELISNPVTTHGNCASFDYEGKSSKVYLMKGRYKFEVWGAQGGDSIGTRHNDSQPGKGGLGGYSTGVLTLNENKMIYISIGGKGQTASPDEGSTTKGGFSDGGDTKTCHMPDSTSVPGTGGGSTSIMLSADSINNRIIVAGGGGGAAGDSYNTTIGGFGGGTTGGKCFYAGSTDGTIPNQGAGTQTGSSCGLGWALNGEPGVFGRGASGKYYSGRDTGGGGGGGWYGGGSGGIGADNCCSSGGGGSGWTFTESSFNEWKLGDSINANNFQIENTYYLTNTSLKGGNEEFPSIDGNGREIGHTGNGYAKITLE